MQNHLLQMLVLVAMDIPGKMDGNDIRNNKVKLLKEMLPVDPNEVVIGQYVGARGKPGYLDDDSIKGDDVERAKFTATYAQIVFRFNSKRWKGVPFIMRGAKAVNEHKCEIRVQFKVPEAAKDHGLDVARNELVMRIYPDEAVWFKMNMKAPGLTKDHLVSDLDLSYGKRFKDAYIPEAYTRLLLAGLRGNNENFVRSDELLAAWETFSPMLEQIEGTAPGTSPRMPIPYKFGSRGPKEADDMLEKLGFQWDTDYTWTPESHLNTKAPMRA